MFVQEKQSIKTSAGFENKKWNKLNFKLQSIDRLEQIDFRLLAVTQSLKILTDFDNLLMLHKTRGKTQTIEQKPTVDLYKLQKVDKCLSSHLRRLSSARTSSPPTSCIFHQPSGRAIIWLIESQTTFFFAVSGKGLFRIRTDWLLPGWWGGWGGGCSGGVSKRSPVVSSGSIVFTLADLSNPQGVSISYLTVFFFGTRFFFG